jgi:signal peptidase I
MTFFVTALSLAVLVWLIVTGWVASDAFRRRRPWFGWAALVWFTNVIGLVAWLVARRDSPVAADRVSVSRRLAIGATAGLPLLFTSVMLSTLAVAVLFQWDHNLGHAMEPTLEDRERFMASKLAYRIGDVQQGDIITHFYPRDRKKSFVKRVIGRPGDTVQIVDGRVSVNGVLLKDDYVPPEFRSQDDWGPAVIPEDSFFVLGDHRNISSDSRHWGYVPKKDVRAKIIARYGGTRGWARIEHCGG